MFYKFENIAFLWAIAFITPILIFFFLWKKKKIKSTIKNLGNTYILSYIIPNHSSKKQTFKFWLQSIALISLCFAMANLQYGNKIVEADRKGLDIIIALDVSNSMLAEDIKPNRLTAAKRAIYQLIKKLKNDRLGIIVFAGEAYVQLPVTSDYSAAKLFLNDIATDNIATQGTDISKAIYLASTSFNPKSKTNKTIIIITDGEDHEQGVDEAINEATSKGIIINTIGMGSEQGSPIPVYLNNKKNGFKKDKKNNTVISKLNADMLTSIANNGNGGFIRATNSNIGLNLIINKLNSLERKKYGTKTFQSYNDHFQTYIALAIILLLIDLFISHKKSTFLRKLKFFDI